MVSSSMRVDIKCTETSATDLWAVFWRAANACFGSAVQPSVSGQVLPLDRLVAAAAASGAGGRLLLDGGLVTAFTA